MYLVHSGGDPGANGDTLGPLLYGAGEDVLVAERHGVQLEGVGVNGLHLLLQPRRGRLNGAQHHPVLGEDL